ncbi:MAG: hypothetical protein AB8F95_09790 [Bacteroidia bacterium]
MNFLAHYYLDNQSKDSLFVIGLVTPDLVSLYSRDVRFRERDINLALQGKTLSVEQYSLLKGVKRHFEADGIFHDSPFFKKESSRIARNLRETFPQYDVARSFFVGHVLFELCIDRILMKLHPGLVDRFYEHFRHYNLEALTGLTASLAGQPLPGYRDFLKRFLEHPYLPRYKDPEYIVRVLKRILMMVGIPESGCEYLDDPSFVDHLVTCESLMEPEMEKGLASIQKKLRPIEHISTR